MEIESIEIVNAILDTPNPYVFAAFDYFATDELYMYRFMIDYIINHRIGAGYIGKPND
jgi:hypothetical protein